MSNTGKKVFIFPIEGRAVEGQTKGKQGKLDHFMSPSGSGREGKSMEKYNGSIYKAGASTYQNSSVTSILSQRKQWLLAGTKATWLHNEASMLRRDENLPVFLPALCPLSLGKAQLTLKQFQMGLKNRSNGCPIPHEQRLSSFGETNQ